MMEHNQWPVGQDFFSDGLHVLPEQLDQSLLADITVDHINHEIGEIRTIFDHQLVAVEVEKIVRSFECSSLVALQEGVISAYSNEESDGEHDGVGLSIRPIIHWL